MGQQRTRGAPRGSTDTAQSWSSSVVQDRRWRKRLDRLTDQTTPPAERIRLARKVLRDGNDLAACVLFHTWRSEDQGTAEHPLRAVAGPMRVRARRILSRPSRAAGRDHREAAGVLRLAPQPRDAKLLLERLEDIHDEDTRTDLLFALTSLHGLPELDGLEEALAALVTSAPSATHPRLAAFIATSPAPSAVALLQRAAAHHTGHRDRWPYLVALLERAPQIGLPLAVAHRDSLPLGDPRRAAVDARLT